MPDTDSYRDHDTDADATENADAAGSVADRFARAVRGLPKPRTTDSRRPFHGIKDEEKKKRCVLVGACVRLGMAVEQIVDFLPTLGLVLSRTQVYEYLGQMRLPRFYKRSEREQSHHDYFTLRFVIRIAQDAAAAGRRMSKLLKGRLPFDGFRFRPDFSFRVEQYQFFLEMQLSDLTETRWSVKFRHYLKLRESGVKFRALFVIDQDGDMTYIRRAAREFLKRSPHQNLFLFITLKDLRGSANVALDPVWMTAGGNEVSLLAYL